MVGGARLARPGSGGEFDFFGPVLIHLRVPCLLRGLSSVPDSAESEPVSKLLF